MRKRVLMAICLSMSLVAAALLAGCNKQEEEPTLPVVAEPTETEPETEEESTVPETEEPETTITERVSVDGKMQSYLTGEWKDEEIVKRRPMAVMMPNNEPAMPLYGISQASIIYEAPVEGRMTRLMALYEDYDDLKFIGPVRSSRDYFIYEAMAYDAIYCNWGLARPYVEELINSDSIDNISEAVAGIYKPASEAFGRRDRGSGYALEFTGYLYPNGYEKAVQRLGYETEYRDSFVQSFVFAADDYPATYDDCEDAVKIYPGGQESNKGGYGNAKPYFEYNEKDGLYYRYEFGKPMVDEYNDEQLAVSNVVFKICHGEVRDEHDYLAFGVHGEGEAYVFTAGKVIHGTWTRDADPEVNRFFDEDGNEIVLNQGKTWLCNIWKEYQEFMKYE